MQLDERELGRPVDGDEEVDPALFGPHLGDIDVEKADRVALEFGPEWLVACGVRKAGDAVALQTAMQG
jgi:hypothetical protein